MMLAMMRIRSRKRVERIPFEQVGLGAHRLAATTDGLVSQSKPRDGIRSEISLPLMSHNDATNLTLKSKISVFLRSDHHPRYLIDDASMIENKVKLR